MILRLLLAEGLKIKRTWMVILPMLGALGILAVLIVDYRLRSEYILGKYPDTVTGFLLEAQIILPITILIGGSLLASLAGSMEHQGNAWKYVLALPVSRWQVYLAKFLILFFLMLLFSGGATVSLACLWKGLGLTGEVPWKTLAMGVTWPVIAALPVLAIQLTLSLRMNNQSVPIIVGVLGALFAPAFANWLPWSYVFQVVPVDYAMSRRFENDPSLWLPIALGEGLIFFIVGMALFQRQEVHS
ncbi:ABC transporter permease [Marininema halotolerans]|uniref:ABC-2 type transport system permease protein n=1 Tax=Marininema halotolerans TaxID=1155944 RepID=A0A1I6NS68_9BACL|nr:ABC transporter permease [Marininema halotolerans]SFS30856.1 hypothetical protein SAMN05444972_10184 [Marininema halotolerans]